MRNILISLVLGSYSLNICRSTSCNLIRSSVESVAIFFFNLLYHFHSSTLSSSKMSAARSWSSPCLCALRAAADQPSRTVALFTGVSIKTIFRMSRSAVRAFCIAISLSKMGLSSRSSSARNCIDVIIVNVCQFHNAKIQKLIHSKSKMR